MKNQTSVKYFRILVFSDYTRFKKLISSIFFLIYLAGVLVNMSIIIIISLESKLHSPMYLFICNLSLVDILYTTVTVPKFLDLLLTGNNIVSFAQCYSQLFFLLAAASTEDILLFIMAYDRYVAICIPLHYQRILNKWNCILMTIGMWVAACFNSLLFTVSVITMSSCHSNIIHQFFCDMKSLTRISCTSTRQFYIVITLEILLFALGPSLCSMLSYIRIFSIILSIKSSDGRRKAFSTCSSHLSVITMYCVSALLAYVLPSYSDILDFVLSVFYVSIIPLLNPIIYSLQNSGIKMALKRLLGPKLS